MEPLPQLGSPSLLVLGDVIVDRYIWGDVERVSPEAPVPVLRARCQEARLGGAGSVAVLARALGARVALAGVVGDDAGGRSAEALLDEAGIDRGLVLRAAGGRTVVKERFIGRASHCRAQQVLRVDHEGDPRLAAGLEGELAGALGDAVGRADAVLVSDYNKGLCTVPLLRHVLEAAFSSGRPCLVDPARVPDFRRYRGATLLKPNRFEAEDVTGVPIRSSSDALAAGRVLRQSCGVGAVVVTLDQDGMALASADTEQVFATCPREVHDVTGAGDMVLAMLGLCLASGVPLPESLRWANLAAGMEVERWGVAPITREDLVARASRDSSDGAGKVLDAERVCHAAEIHRREGRTIVFTNGCFDLLHAGHLRCLEEAARLGSVLIVAVNSDASVRRLKGPGRPVVPHQDRARLVAGLECVDHVLIFDDTPCDLLRRIRPDVLVKGGTYRCEEVEGRDVVTSYGGRVCVTGCVEGISTTRVLAAVRGECR